MPSLIASATLKDAFNVAKSGKVRNLLLAGPRGVGKTTFAFLLADLLKRPPYKIQHHAEGSVAEAIGMWVPDGDKFRWEPGPLDLAYQNGGILIHDEIVEAAGPMKTFMYGAWDNGRGGEISYVGRTFKPVKGMMNIGTMNGWPFEGALPEALLDRIDATFIITKPSPAQYKTLDPDLAEMCEDAYLGAKDPMEGPPFTFRFFKSFQTLRTLLPLEQAAVSALQGNAKLAGTFLEALALRSDDDDEGLIDDLDEEDDDE